jgi:hypothetical protein
MNSGDWWRKQDCMESEWTLAGMYSYSVCCVNAVSRWRINILWFTATCSPAPCQWISQAFSMGVNSKHVVNHSNAKVQNLYLDFDSLPLAGHPSPHQLIPQVFPLLTILMPRLRICTLTPPSLIKHEELVFSLF